MFFFAINIIYKYSYAQKVPIIKVYRIRRSIEYKRMNTNKKEGEDQIQNNEEENKECKDIITLDEFCVIENEDLKNKFGANTYMADDVRSAKITKFFVDNKGNTILYYRESELFMINGKNIFTNFSDQLTSRICKPEDIEILKFSQELILVKHKERILSIGYDPAKQTLKKFKAINHIILDENFSNLIPSKDPRYFLLSYNLGNTKTIIIWDIKTNMEHSHFSSRDGDVFYDYMTGKRSKMGFV
jgi:hypothetical protein